ncbi:hypothetical protein B7463_g9907, partial [Scytalidium lignicola]
MPPPLQRFGGAPNSLASHYQQYPAHSQAHTAGLPPPLASNPTFMNANSMNNPFTVNGNTLGLSGGYGAAGLSNLAAGTGLASQAAQMGFAHGGAQQQAHNGMMDTGARGVANKGRIREVWKGNLEEEMATLRQLVDKYPYIAMDTEFPGLVARPMGSFRGKSDYHYQCLRCNVDLLQIIQIGITLFSEEGDSPPAQLDDMSISGGRKYGGNMVPLPCTWQFNFKFSLKDDMYSQVSIDALQQAGVDFQSLERDGIDPFDFAALLISSGLVCDEDVRWISFHGGYDFGYLTKLLICKPLPDDEVEFDKLMKKFFPSIYDIKYLMKYAIKQHTMGQLTPLDPNSAEVLAKFEQKSGLENIAETFKIKRQGAAHQAGSDSLLTGKVFFKMRERIFNGDISDEHLGKVWGLGFPEHYPQHYHQQMQDNATPNQNGSYTNGTPSTPNTGKAGLVSTPGHNSNGTGVGSLTPGGGGGVFGNFQFGK